MSYKNYSWVMAEGRAARGNQEAPKENEIVPKETMTWTECMHWIAQSAINIHSGLTTINPDSKVHQAMEELCRKFQEMEKGQGKLPKQWKGAAVHLAGYEQE